MARPTRHEVSFVKGTYASGLGAARQLSIRAQARIHVGDAALPGATTTGSPLPVPLNSRVYGVLTLGNDQLGIAQFFDQEFAPATATVNGECIPVTRIDISGLRDEHVFRQEGSGLHRRCASRPFRRAQLSRIREHKIRMRVCIIPIDRHGFHRVCCSDTPQKTPQASTCSSALSSLFLPC